MATMNILDEIIKARRGATRPLGERLPGSSMRNDEVADMLRKILEKRMQGNRKILPEGVMGDVIQMDDPAQHMLKARQGAAADFEAGRSGADERERKRMMDEIMGGRMGRYNR